MENIDFQPPCVKCGGKCCQYIAIEIDKPKTKNDYDYIIWYLLHQNVNIFIDHNKKWHVEFKSPCETLSKNNRCNIYNSRPKICRIHGKEEYECEHYDSPYLKYFKTADQLKKYLNDKNIDWKYKRL